MKIAILGYDVEGKSSFEFFQSQGNELEIRDQNTSLDVPPGTASVLGEAYLDGLDQFDLVVRTAGLQPQKILAKNPGIQDKITTHINEFLKASPTKNIIGVTGTKGKGTTCTLIANMLEADDKDVKLGGNIGIPPLGFLDGLDKDSWVVLELSSFQLIDLKTSPHIGVCLMVVPEHLDWHPDINDYTTAKARLFKYQDPADIAIYLSGNELSELITSGGRGVKLPYYEPPGAFVDNGVITIESRPIYRTSDLKLLGEHNWQNICAAVTAVWQVTQNTTAIRSVLGTFSGLPHRLEMVRELEDVRYYDDSFGTTPETAMVAIAAFKEPEIVILGGRGKGIPFDELAKKVAASPNVKKVIAIGEMGPEIAARLNENGFTRIVVGGRAIEEIVAQARKAAAPGDVVLLSTACTSFDMFKNYKQRGEKFTAAVKALA